MGPKKERQPPEDAIQFRMDQGLTKRDLEFVKDELVKFLVNTRADMRMWRATKKDNIDSFLDHLEDASPIWAGLGPIDDIWDDTVIYHLRNYVKNQLRDGGAPILAKMENYRQSQGLMTSQDQEEP